MDIDGREELGALLSGLLGVLVGLSQLLIDVSQIALSGIVLAGWIVFWGTLTVRTVARLFAPARSR